MAKDSVSDWDTTTDNNSDIGGTNISSTGNVSQGDDALRKIMAQIASYTRRGSDLATASTLNLDSIDSLWLDITGTTTVTAVTLTSGHVRFARAAAAFTLTASSSLIVNGSTGTSYTTTAGDLLFFEGYASSVVRVWTVNPQSAGATAYPPGYLWGLTLSNNSTDATNDIDIAVGTCRSSDDTANIDLTSALTKRLDATFTAGTGNGMLDTGSVANGTYHIYVIKNPTTGAVDVLASTSATSPTMPTGYTLKRRISSILRESAAIVGFVQFGDTFYRKAAALNYNTANPGTSAITITCGVPTGIQVFAFGNAVLQNGGSGTGTVAYLSSFSQNDGAVSSSGGALVQIGLAYNAAGGTQVVATPYNLLTNTSGQIRARLSGSDANITLRVSTLGWIDTRGRFN